MGMLAVDLDQVVAQGLEVRHRDGLAIDPGLGAAGSGDHAAQQAVVAGELARLEPGAGGGQVGDVEAGGEVGSLAAMADAAGIRSFAEHRPSAPSRMDFPAPVSPVMAVMPPSSSSAR